MAVNPSAYQLLMNGFRNTFAPTAPAGASIYDQARADAQRQAMAQLGMGLVGAAVPQTPTMRAQALQQAFAGMGNMGTNIYNAAQLRLAEQKATQESEALASQKALLAQLTGTGTAATVPTAPKMTVTTPGAGNLYDGGFKPVVQPVVQPAPQNTFGLTDSQRKYVRGLEAGGDVSGAVQKALEFSYANANPQATSEVGKILSDPALNQFPDIKMKAVAAATSGNLSELGKILADPELAKVPGLSERLREAYVRSKEQSGLSQLQVLVRDEAFKEQYPDIWKAAVEKLVAKEGFSIETSPDGSVRVRQGDAPDSGVMTGELAKAWRGNLNDAQKVAEGAARDITTTNELLGLIDQGVNFGEAGGVYNWLNTQLANLGVVNQNGETINTNAYAAIVGNRVGEIIKQFGAGTGLSNADREFAMKIAAADPTKITPEDARKLLTIADKANRLTIEKYTKKYIDPLAKRAESNPELGIMLESFKVDMPPAYVPPYAYE